MLQTLFNPALKYALRLAGCHFSQYHVGFRAIHSQIIVHVTASKVLKLLKELFERK